MTKLSIGNFLAVITTACAADPAITVWFEQPAAKSHQSLVLGNGRIGAMVFGGVDEERIVFNESSVWSGSRADVLIPGGYKAYFYGVADVNVHADKTPEIYVLRINRKDSVVSR